LGNAPDAAPKGVAGAEDFLKDGAGFGVAFIRRCPAVGIDRFVPADGALLGHEAESEKDIRRVKARHDAGCMEFLGQKTVRRYAENGGDVPGQ
jgi:hypothetical protein